MSVTEKVGEFLNMLTMQYELRYQWWINAVVIILSVPHCLCWLFYFQNISTFLFEKLSCAVESLIWSDTVDFLTKLLGMPYSVVTVQQACSTEIGNYYIMVYKYLRNITLVHLRNSRFWFTAMNWCGFTSPTRWTDEFQNWHHLTASLSARCHITSVHSFIRSSVSYTNINTSRQIAQSDC